MTNAYQRLSGQDSSFLVFEGPTTHMHVGGVAIFDAKPLRTAAGGVDIGRIAAYIESRLAWIPRYRQRLAFTPLENAPVWVDDAHFNLRYHLRHTSLPRPGDEAQLKLLAARIMSQQLDRGKPLWEAWIVEGLEGDRFALLSKAHHCMVDGIGSVDLITVLLRPTPDTDFEEPPPWRPRPMPAQLELLQDAVARRARAPLELWQGLRGALADPQESRTWLAERVSAAWSMIGAGLRPPAATPLNQPIGPHRRFDWLMLDLAEVKRVKSVLGGTVNDVVLAVVAGALRRFLGDRGVDVGAIDYRVVLPVSRRPDEDRGTLGNRVSAWLTSLPIQERDPRRRLEKVCAITAQLKESKQALGAEALTQVGEWVGTGILTLGVRLAARLHPYNLIVTNVPGPQFPFYLLGAEMVAGYPEVPLFDNQGLGIALFSYAGKLCWGFNADFDLLPDLAELVRRVAESFDELRAAAAPPQRHPAAAKSRRARKKSSAA